ncbi:MAG: prolyl oligopeptidase family serine peptidase [Hamadaea sp.]|uniref:prolyl oligopeptidase family serine peptidase n=1 Tax=Hamadaea sp. TaxID=2024425 RepID=UPI0018411CED|nr:prolyl oligopeptidase family serine peptidase [Hamadaea sp.]NUR72401.1 prolyl oligopeptidase family serine peptidase [Hamadaea sp.]NUT22161.1 prolyl oligopeptidase family serine peptidase [Hamadaea sp.]
MTDLEPRRLVVGRDGERVAYLLGGRLCVLDTATGAVRPVAAEVEAYACDLHATVAVFARDGRLHRVRLTGEPEVVDLGVEGEQPQPDPTSRHIAYRHDRALYVLLDAVHSDPAPPQLLAGEESLAVRWGDVDDDALGFGRNRGWWWAPDGSAILAARTDGPRSTSLHLLELDGGWVDVHWDRWVYPYVAGAGWSDGPPLVTVLRRGQNHGLVLAVDPRTGETQVHAELSDPRFVRTVDGTPLHLPDGRVLVGSEIAHESYDSRCLFADGTLLTPPNLYVRRVVGRIGPMCLGPGLPAFGVPVPAEPRRTGDLDNELGDLLIEASTDPAEQHLYRVRGALGRGGGMAAQRLTHEPGWHTGECGGETMVIGSAGLDHPGTRWTVLRRGHPVGVLGPVPAEKVELPRPVLDRVTDRRLPVGVLYPARHLVGRRLPVLLDLATDLGGQSVLARSDSWALRQRWAEAGYAVVAVDARGSAGIAPSFEKVVHRRLVDLVVADLAETVHELGAKDPDLDLEHVLLRGAGVGGWLAARAVADRPETFHGAVIRDPVRTWTALPPVVAERYLGNPDDNSEVWLHHELRDLPVGVRELPGDASFEAELSALEALRKG